MQQEIVVSLTWGNIAFLVGGVGVGALGKWIGDRLGRGTDIFLGEKLKNIATHQDIDLLVERVRATEDVKSEISDRMWDRQERWEFKRDTYVELLHIMADMLVIEYKDRLGPLSPELLKRHEELARLSVRASIVLSDTANTILREMVGDNSDESNTTQWLQDHLNNFVKAARDDLGYNPITLPALTLSRLKSPDED